MLTWAWFPFQRRPLFSIANLFQLSIQPPTARSISLWGGQAPFSFLAAPPRPSPCSGHHHTDVFDWHSRRPTLQRKSMVLNSSSTKRYRANIVLFCSWAKAHSVIIHSDCSNKYFVFKLLEKQRVTLASSFTPALHTALKIIFPNTRIFLLFFPFSHNPGSPLSPPPQPHTTAS